MFSTAIRIYNTYDTSWRSETRPLNEETVLDLCLQFDLESTHKLCKPGAVVYGPDFYSLLRAKYANGDYKKFEQIDSKFGKYLDYCENEQVEADGTVTYRCFYNFQRDGFFSFFVIYKSIDNDVIRLHADTGDKY